MSDQREGGIAWTDETWNPVRGCSRVSVGCDNCYAMGVAYRFRGPGLAYEGLATLRNGKADWTGHTSPVPSHMADPLRWKRARRIFVNSMSDLFHESLTFEFIAAVFGVMAASDRHTFQVLTKRPKRAREFFDWLDQQPSSYTRKVGDLEIQTSTLPGTPHNHAIRLKTFAENYLHMYAPDEGYGPFADCGLDVRSDKTDPSCFTPVAWPLPNVWLGVSVEDQRAAEKRIAQLLELPAAVRFISAEPLLGPLQLDVIRVDDFCSLNALTGEASHAGRGNAVGHTAQRYRRGIDWLIVGGESGERARPFDVCWAEDLVRACADADVACFVKQLGAVPFDSRESDRTTDEPHPGGPSEDPSCRLNLASRKGGDMDEWPEALRVQQFPKAS